MIALLLLAAQAAAPAPIAAPVAATAPAPIPADQRAAAEEVVRVAQVAAVLRITADKQVAAMRSGAILSAQLDQNPAIRMQRARNPQAWDAAILRIAAKQADAFAKLVAEMQPAIADQAVHAYASNFTLAELRQLAAFYQTPLGRRLVERTPALSADTAAWMQQELPRRMAAVAATLAPEIQRELAPLLAQPAK